MHDPSDQKEDNGPLRGSRGYFLQYGITAFCVIVASIFVFFLIYRVTDVLGILKNVLGILTPFVYGFVMAYLLMPVFNWLYRELRPPLAARLKNGSRVAKGLSSILAMLFGVAIVGGLLWMVLPQLVQSIIQLLPSMDTYLNEISNGITAFFKSNPTLEHNFLQYYDQFSQELVKWVQSLAPQLVGLMTSVIGTVSVLFDVLVGVIIALYVLNSKDTFCAQGKKALYSMMSVKTANRVLARVNHVHRVFGGFITGKLIDSMIIGVLCFIGLKMIGIKYELLIAVIIGVTNIIPFFGPFIGAIPSALLIAAINPWHALYFCIFILFLQQFDGNILGPKILGDSTGLSSFWVMFAILVFGGVFGFVGMAIGVPVFAVLYSIATERFNNLLKKRGLPTDTANYRGACRIDPETHRFMAASEAEPVSKRAKARAAKEGKQEDEK